MAMTTGATSLVLGTWCFTPRGDHVFGPSCQGLSRFTSAVVNSASLPENVKVWAEFEQVGSGTRGSDMWLTQTSSTKYF